MTDHRFVSHVPSPSVLRRCRRAAAALLVTASATAASAAVVARPLAAQQPASPTAAAATKSAARLELERQLAALESSGRASDAAALRRRLSDGDFQVGDRIALNVSGSLTVNDTLSVHEDQVITVPTLPDISLRGVLRPDLNDYLTAQISRYVRDPIVRSTSLVRVSISGAVARPGFYALPADILLGDAIMHAGGPLATADMQRTVVRRGKKDVVSKGAVQRAVLDGTTIAQLGVRAGDEIAVGEKKQRNWASTIAVTTGIITSVVTLLYFINR